MNRKATEWSPHLLSLLRIVVAILFMQHGAQKMFGVLGAPRGPAELYSQAWVAGILELYGGGLLALGLGTRIVAFLLSGTMAVAYFQVHAPQHPLPIVNKGELAVLYCFVFLYFVFSGAGPWSLDRLIASRRARYDQASEAVTV